MPGNLEALCSPVVLKGMLYSLRPSPQQLNHLPVSGLGAWTAKPGAIVELQPRLCFVQSLASFPWALWVFFFILCCKSGFI